MFEIKNVTKKYDSEYALKDISMTIGKGMNFLVGSSGSGKTTLLKIMSGMETDFSGEVFCGNKNIKELTKDEKSYFYNHVFGFIWQDFNLLEDLSVMENILLPTHLNDEKNTLEAKNLLRSMKLSTLANKKVKLLSGGQKQRVAIARELMKNPQIILADEPTSALDEKTAKEIMHILRLIAKKKTVIMVTHDTSFITHNDQVFELDKGELIRASESEEQKPSLDLHNSYHLSMKNAFTLTMMNFKRHFGRFLISLGTLMIASLLLLTTFSGAITSNNQESFDDLLATYGEGILDMNIVSSYMNASGTDGDEGPNGEVTQDIAGLYEQYAQDERVDFVLYSQAFDNISIQMEGKNYRIESSGSAPVINKLISGTMPKGEGNEVVVSNKFVEQSGLTKDSILGKEIDFTANMNNWDSGTPVSKEVNLKGTVVGVSDNTAVYDYEGESFEYTIDDSFFFSKAAQENMRNQAGLKNGNMAFSIRAKTPENLISIKNELTKKGINPLGRFELVEDMVRLQDQTNEQSNAANIVIGLLGMMMVVAVFTLTDIMRKRELAIYKICGYSLRQLTLIGMMETIVQAMIAITFLFCFSPILNDMIMLLFHVRFKTSSMVPNVSIIIFILSLISYFVYIIIIKKIDIIRILKLGDEE